MTSVNVMMTTGMRDNDTKGIPAWRGSTGESEIEPDVERAYVQVNFTEGENFELCNTFGKKGKKALQKHCIKGERVLLVIQTVPMKYGISGAVMDTVTFFNTGATCSVVRNQFAKEHDLYGQEVVITLSTIKGTSDVTTKLYLVELLDRDGVRRIVKAFGMDSIPGKLPTVNYENLKTKFSPRNGQA